MFNDLPLVNEKFKKVYWAPNLSGNELTRPLKIYHGFFFDKLSQSSGLWKIALSIVYLVTAIFAYLLFGLLAGIGMLFNLLDLKQVKPHNEHVMRSIASMLCSKWPQEENDLELDVKIISSTGYELKERDQLIVPGIKKEEITKARLVWTYHQIDQEINRNYTRHYTKVYYHCSGNWLKGFTFKIMVPQSRIAYCDRGFYQAGGCALVVTIFNLLSVPEAKPSDQIQLSPRIEEVQD